MMAAFDQKDEWECFARKNVCRSHEYQESHKALGRLLAASGLTRCGLAGGGEIVAETALCRYQDFHQCSPWRRLRE